MFLSRKFFVPGHSQQMFINKTHITANRYEKVKFEWHLSRGEYKKIDLEFYRNDSADFNNMLINDREELTKTSINLFGHRLSPTINGDPRNQNYSYIVTITDLQYSDTGLFYLEALFIANAGKTNAALSSTIKLNVTGR